MQRTHLCRIIENGDIMATKTNAVRLVQQAKLPCRESFYEFDENDLNGNHAAAAIGFPPEQVFKTLVARGASKKIYVYVVPVAMSLDLKKAAKAAGEKSIAMVGVSEINGLTGYVRGGCSPIGMKKNYPCFYHESILQQNTVMVSAGKIGYQVELTPNDLIKLTSGKTADIAAEE